MRAYTPKAFNHDQLGRVEKGEFELEPHQLSGIRHFVTIIEEQKPAKKAKPSRSKKV